MKRQPLFNDCTKHDMQMMKMYLMKKGVPMKMIDEIRIAFINDAIRQSTDMKYDRIYAGIALAARRAFGFGYKRLMRLMHEFDDLAAYVGENTEGYDWVDIMQELRDETGIVVQTDSENRLIFEYIGNDLEDATEVE